MWLLQKKSCSRSICLLSCTIDLHQIVPCRLELLHVFRMFHSIYCLPVLSITVSLTFLIYPHMDIFFYLDFLFSRLLIHLSRFSICKQQFPCLKYNSYFTIFFCMESIFIVMVCSGIGLHIFAIKLSYISRHTGTHTVNNRRLPIFMK